MTIFNKVIQTDDDYVYFTIQVKSTNNLRLDDYTTYWELDDTSHWVAIYSHTVATSLTTTFNMQVEELTQEGNVNQVSIGNNGFMHWSTDSKFFHVNEDETSYYIHYAGGTRSYGNHLHGSIDYYGTDLLGNWIIRYPYSETSVRRTILRQTHSTKVQTTREGYALGLFNDGNSTNRNGLLIQCGVDTPTTADNYAITVKDGNGTTVRFALFDDSVLNWYHSSDARLKAEIKEVEGLDTLEALSKVKLKSGNGEEIRKRDTR